MRFTLIEKALKFNVWKQKASRFLEKILQFQVFQSA